MKILYILFNFSLINNEYPYLIIFNINLNKTFYKYKNNILLIMILLKFIGE